MAAGNKGKHEIVESSVKQDSYYISASCRIQDLAGIYINPEDSIAVDAESAHLQKDSNSETPNKYPNAPHSSPIDLQNDPGSSFFNAELVKCLNELPLILLSLEDKTKYDSSELLGYEAETYFDAPSSPDSKSFEKYQYPYENSDKHCFIEAMTVTPSSQFEEDSTSESARSFTTNANNCLEKFNLLTIDSIAEFDTDPYSTNTLSSNTSIIANWPSDESEMSLGDGSLSSDDNSSHGSRDRIEFEALALDSTIHSSNIQRFQHWKTRGKNKRALSLDEMNPSKLFHTADFAGTSFELTF